MASLFEDRSGYVAIIPGTATKAILRVRTMNAHGTEGSFPANVVFATQFHIQRGINSNVAYTLDNRIFLSAAGDRLGSLRMQGLAFDTACDASGKKHGGFTQLTEFYKKNRLVSRGESLPYLEVFYGVSNDEKHVGYLSGLVAGTSSLSMLAMDFTLECLLVP